MKRKNRTSLTEEEQQKYQSKYSETKLEGKLIRFAKRAGIEVVYYVLLLYQVMLDGHLKDILIITAALGYFISPVDAIPDIFPGAGFLDDISILLGALASVSSSITPEVKAKAKARLHQWFDFDEDDLNTPYK